MLQADSLPSEPPVYLYMYVYMCGIFLSFLPLDSIAKINSKRALFNWLKNKKKAKQQTNEHLNEIKYNRDFLGLHDIV